MLWWLHVAWLPQRLKSTYYEIFSHSAGDPFGASPFKNVDFILWDKQMFRKIALFWHIFFLRKVISRFFCTFFANFRALWLARYIYPSFRALSFAKLQPDPFAKVGKTLSLFTVHTPYHYICTFWIFLIILEEELNFWSFEVGKKWHE